MTILSMSQVALNRREDPDLARAGRCFSPMILVCGRDPRRHGRPAASVARLTPHVGRQPDDGSRGRRAVLAVKREETSVSDSYPGGHLWSLRGSMSRRLIAALIPAALIVVGVSGCHSPVKVQVHPAVHGSATKR